MGAGAVLRVGHIRQKPNECGSTSLLQILRYYKSDATIEQIQKEANSANKLGDWDYRLGTFALTRNFNVTIFDNNLYVYDPTWFDLSSKKLLEKIHARFEHVKRMDERDFASRAWHLPALAAIEEFLKNGGRVDFTPLSKELIVSYLDKGVPLICSLAIEYLYNTPRVYKNKSDDVRGISYGHFVTIVGYEGDSFLVLDPEKEGVFSSTARINMDTLVNAILRRRDGTLMAIEKN